MDSLWTNIFRRSSDDSVYALLQDIPLFEGLSHRELSAIEDILHRREYESDEVLFRQGNPGVGMYIIQEGLIEITYEPTQDTLAELEDGDFFGELALLNETPRSATAIAREPSVLFGLFRPDLLGLFNRAPSLGIEVLLRMSRVISERLIQSNDQVQLLRTQVQELEEKLERSRTRPMPRPNGPSPSAGTPASSSASAPGGVDADGSNENGVASDGAGAASNGRADSEQAAGIERSFC